MTTEGRSAWLVSPRPINGLLTGCAVGWLLLFGNPLELQEHRWFDQCLRWRLAAGLAPSVDQRVVHVEMTDTDLAGLPTLEAEYEAAARLIREATALGADVIAIDVIYGRTNEAMARPILEALRATPRVVLAEGLVGSPGSGALTRRVRSFPFLSIPHAPSGIINIRADRDGVHRRYQVVHATPDGPAPSLALSAYFALKGIAWPTDVTIRDGQHLTWQELSSDGTALAPHTLRVAPWPLLDFRSGWTASGPAAFPHLTLSELHHLDATSQTDGRKPLAGRILFVSYVAPGISEFGATPFGPQQPLVHLHSTALNDLLQGTSHRRASRWLDALWLLSCLLMAWGASRCRTTRTLSLWWMGGGALLLAAGAALILKTAWVMPSVFAASLWMIAGVLELIRRHACEFIERLKLRTTMGYYFSPLVLKRVLANPGSMEPQQVELTVLLTDLRNFTPMSERVGTRGVFALCNQVFEAQTRAIMAEEGCLEHFLGDQFLSYWGAPEPQPDAADRALRAALALITAMEQARTQIDPRIQALFGYGVALHAGMAMIGNKGSRQRMDYGVLGDLINTAARVESLTKYYRVPLLITREVYHKLSRPPVARWVDTVLPVGKSTPLDLLEVPTPLSSPQFEQIARDYAGALEQYRQGRFDAAREQFARLVEQHGDAPSRLLAHRCEELLAHPPEQWAGVYQFTSK